MAEAVLDASAVLAMLNAEPGANAVAEALPGAVMSAVNLSEVVSKLSSTGMTDNEIDEVLRTLRIETVPFDEEQAFQSGLLRNSTKNAGLSLGDRACLNLARRLGVPALTADKTWVRLSTGAEIRLIR